MSERPETGPMQFPDDWPGVFIRGDNALAYSHVLGRAVAALKDDDAVAALVLQKLAGLLGSCGVPCEAVSAVLAPPPAHE